jgi:uncharacterized protein (UPF0218 family)
VADDGDAGGPGGDDTAGGDGGAAVVLTLPEALRSAFKEPFGPVHTETEGLLADAGEPLIAVGDVVTHHLTATGARPDAALVDGLTEREAVAEALAPEIEGYDRAIEVANPAATLTVELLAALAAAIEEDGSTVVVVDGEEDLATLPALAVAPEGASVVYGQPGAGMVHVRIDRATRERARDLLSRMEGDHDRAWAVLEGGRD